MDINSTSQPVVFLFAGQGNPVIGMGADLWNINQTTRAIWDCASDISGMDIRRLCLKGPMNRLIQTTVQQIAVTAMNATLYTLCKDKFDDTNVIGSCGHSVGEYSALYAAGAVTLENLFRLIQLRSHVMDEVSRKYKGNMLAVKDIDHTALSQMIIESDLPIDISCDNSCRQQVVGGTIAALNEFSRQLRADGHEIVKLGVSGAWHTRLMAEGVPFMRQYLSDFEFCPPQHDVVMNVTGKAENEPAQIKENLSLHLTHTVKWADSMSFFLTNNRPVLFVEISNKAYLGKVLKDFVNFNPEMILHCRGLFSI
ncbi:ACP S-malonyltransferase [Kosakonia sacchari]|uniref:ACP S-malonyltransferase n=1 Tax=Kosakonia sacchari TaxID=1158459 RepID=UPI001584E770|nr:ACP S-malonyltransferase [Kosakonia sacchari]MDN2484588.1 ACP S-malonyltransferase [Kosakonia sacchari]NUL35638.1 ACP S-malonyltransferase [Kosakonia sacchari]